MKIYGISINVLIDNKSYELNNTDLLNNMLVSDIKNTLLEHFNNHNTILNSKLYNDLISLKNAEIISKTRICYIVNLSLSISFSLVPTHSFED